MKKKEIKNLGVILGQSSPTTFAGGTIPYEVRVENGDWAPYLPVGEKQTGREDYFDCVSRSLTNSVEIQEKFLTRNESNYCDRELALGSGTTRQGNYLDKVAEYARTTGLAQQSTYPDSGGTWDEQYAPIPQDIKNQLELEKLAWKAKWDIKYEVIPFDKTSLKYHLKQAPLQVVIPGHAVVDILCEEKVSRIFDSYQPFEKSVPSEYYPSNFVYAMKIVLYKKEQALDNDYLFIDLKFGDTGKQILKLKRALTRLGWDNARGIKMETGDVYNENLAWIVMNYKLANLSDGIWGRFWESHLFKGRKVDAKTRENINTNIIKRNV